MLRWVRASARGIGFRQVKEGAPDLIDFQCSTIGEAWSKNSCYGMCPADSVQCTDNRNKSEWEKTDHVKKLCLTLSTHIRHILARTAQSSRIVMDIQESYFVRFMTCWRKALNSPSSALSLSSTLGRLPSKNITPR